MEFIRNYFGQATQKQMLAVREDQALVSAMLRQAVRHGLLRANQVVLARDMFTVTKDDDDQLINSNEKSRTIWIVIQQVMAGNQDELREMAAIFTNDTHFDEAKAMRLISVVVKTLIPASSPKANARVIALLSFTSALVEGLYPHGMGAVRSVTSAMEKEIHTLMEEHLIQIVERKTVAGNMAFIGLFGAALLGAYYFGRS